MTSTQNTEKTYPDFTKSFSELKDPRRTNKGNFTYPLNEILFLTISAVISGMNGWTAINEFGNIKLSWLRKHFPFEDGIPSHDVLGSIFAKLDPKQFNLCFIDWVNELSVLTKGEVIAFDGKSIRRSDNKFTGKRAFHVLTAYATGNKICLGQISVDEKENEIVAIPKLLDLLVVKDCIITIDAMGCQKKIAEKIIEKEADYLLMVKDNQKIMHLQIKDTFNKFNGEKSCVNYDLGHGRVEKRTCEVTENLTLIKKENDWVGLRSLVKITSVRYSKQTGKETIEMRYYISSLSANPQRANDAVRKHWHIENTLHWVLDVVFKEDDSLKKKGDSSINYNVITKIALSLLGKETSSKKSNVLKRHKSALSDEYREKILNI